jgi:hypothetical protein
LFGRPFFAIFANRLLSIPSITPFLHARLPSRGILDPADVADVEFRLPDRQSPMMHLETLVSVVLWRWLPPRLSR